jgi:Flp pilus assembly pilin Flp
MSAGATLSARLSGVWPPRGHARWQSGQGMVEYAFILVLIALVVIVMLITTGGQIKNLFSDITYTLNNQAGL